MSNIRTFRFRDFSVYKNAIAFRGFVKMFLRNFPNEERYRLIDQIDRASLSAILNIAEGSAKKSDKEFARFLEISIASTSEVVAGFDCAFADDYITEEDLQSIEERAEILARQIGSFMRTLRNSKS